MLCTGSRIQIEGRNSHLAVHVIYSRHNDQYTSVVDCSEAKEVKVTACSRGVSLAKLMNGKLSASHLKNDSILAAFVYRCKVSGSLSTASSKAESPIRHHPTV